MSIAERLEATINDMTSVALLYAKNGQAAHDDFTTALNVLRDSLAHIRDLEARVPQWVSVAEKRPKLGQKVVLFSNGVVQHSMYVFDAEDNGAHMSYIWADEESETIEPVKQSDIWTPLPHPPAQGVV